MNPITNTPAFCAPPIRVFMVEDQAKVLRTQQKLLAGHSELEIVGTATSGEAALQEIGRLKPDVLLLDLGLPRMSGVEVTRSVKASMPQVKILILTIFDEEEKVLHAVQAGASGYLLKGTPTEKIIDAIQEVCAGGAVIQPTLAARLLKYFRVDTRANTGFLFAAEPPGKKLSARETEILQLIAKGVSNSEAASMLNLAKTTIRTHLEHIYQKLEVNNRVEAVTEGLRKGLIQV